MLHASHCINVRYRAAIAAKNMGGKLIIFDGKGTGMGEVCCPFYCEV